MAKNIITNFQKLSGEDSNGNHISFNATYDSKASINVHIVDNFPTHASVENFGRKGQNFDIPKIAIGAVPSDQIGDVISGSVYAKAENIHNNTDSVVSNNRFIADASFVALHELIVHLIDQQKNADAAHDSGNELIGARSSKFTLDEKTNTGKLFPLTTKNINNNLFQPSAPNKASFVLSGLQLTKILNNILEGLKNNDNDPCKNIENNIPINNDKIIPNEKVNTP